MSIFSPIEDIIFFVGILIRLIIFEQISGIKLNNIAKLTISLLLTVIQILFFNLYLLIEPISLLVVLQFFKTKWNKTQKLFYGLLPIVIGDMFQRIISLYLRFIFNVDIEYANNSLLFDILLPVLLVPFYYGFFKGLRIEEKYLKVDTIDRDFRTIFWGLNTLFISYLVLIRGNLFLEILIEGRVLNVSLDTYFIRTNILNLFYFIYCEYVVFKLSEEREARK
ncbi:hypothetical protein [Streptococcus suis]|uniref:hypothetical protein n=1 Tax=Streptococcus suis TaxID=1307 RepID=UPI0037A808F8